MGSASLPEGVVRSLSFSGLSVFLSPRSLERLKIDLVRCGAKRVSAAEWASASLFTALCAAALAAFAALAASSEVLVGVAVFFLVFALVFAVCFNFPRLAAAKRAEEIERDFAVALRSIAIQLAAGESFESVLKREAKGGAQGDSELSQEFGRVLRDSERIGLGSSLTAAGARCASPLGQRAFAQLRFAAEHGGRGEAAAATLRKLADELVATQKVRAREFAAKQAFFGLLFVSVACVAPALFAAYVIVGGAFLELSFGATEVLLAFVVLFPLIDAAILAFLLWKTPKLLVG